jgi:di/tricarboxylate transporter
MWLHNVTAAVMMMPVATGILHRLPPANEQSELMNKFNRAVILTFVYATQIGGISTITGTGVNLIIIGMWKNLVPEAKPISFNTWFFFGFPVAVLLLVCFWCILCLLYVGKDLSRDLSNYLDRAHLKRDLEALGKFLSSNIFYFCLKYTFGSPFCVFAAVAFASVFPVQTNDINGIFAFDVLAEPPRVRIVVAAVL